MSKETTRDNGAPSASVSKIATSRTARSRRGAPGTWAMALRNIGRRPRRSVLSAAAIGIAAMVSMLLFSLVSGLSAGLASDIQRYLTAQVLVEDSHYERSSINTLGLFVPNAEETRRDLEEIPGVSSASPRINAAGSVFSEGDTLFFPVLGLDFQSDPMNAKSMLRPGERLPAKGSREALVSRALATQLGLKTGDVLTAVTQTLRGSSNGMSFTVTGIINPRFGQFAAPYLFADVDTVSRFVHLGDAATQFLVSAASIGDSERLARDIDAMFAARAGNTVSAVAWDNSSSSLTLIRTANAFYVFIGFVFFCLASTVIINTMLMVVLERSREIGTLSAMGMDRRKMRNLFLSESAVLSGIGALSGVILGSAVSLILGRVGLDFSAAMQGMSVDFSPIMRPKLDWFTPVLVFAGATAVATAFTLLPLRKINSLSIVDALRGEQ